MTDRPMSLTWRKSSYSSSNSNCVEVAAADTSAVAVRDSKDPHGPVLVFGAGEWRTFVAGITAGGLNPS